MDHHPNTFPAQSPTTSSSSTSRPLIWTPNITSTNSTAITSPRGSIGSSTSCQSNASGSQANENGGDREGDCGGSRRNDGVDGDRLWLISHQERREGKRPIGPREMNEGGERARRPSKVRLKKGEEVRQIPSADGKSSAIAARDGAEWVCRKCGGKDKLWSNKGQRKLRRDRRGRRGGISVDREEEEEWDEGRNEGVEFGPSLLYGPWLTLAQIVHRKSRSKSTKRRRRRPILTESQQSSMDSNEDEGEKQGCKEVFCGKRMKEWAFWFIVAFLAALTIRDLYNLIKEYTENPKKSDMNVRFNETMRMPNITFCMSRAQAWSHFKLNGSENSAAWERAIQTQLKNMTDRKSFLKNQWEFGMVMETYNLISTLTSMERETTAHGTVNSIDKFRTQERLAEIRKLTKFWLAELEKRGVTFEEFLQKVGKETLRRSMQRFQRTTFDEDLIIKTQLSITWLSQMQLCFQPQFDEENFKPIDEQGEFFVMVLSHNAEKLDGEQVDCMSADFHGRPSSSSRFMGSKGVMKDGFTDELCIGMMHETTVDVKARYKMLPNDEEGTACRDNEDEEGEDNEWNCYLRCRMEFIRELCNCTAPTLSYLATKGGEDELEKWPLCDYAECKVDVQGRNYSDEECTKGCFRNCDQIRFNVDHQKKGKSARPDFTTVILKWGSFEYLTLEQNWVWSPTTFISAIGGSIGMWLGLSILSLIQGSTYLITYVEHKVVEKRKQQRSASITTEEPKKLSRAQGHAPKLSKIHIDDEDKLATNPFASPFKKLSHAAPPIGNE